MKKPNLKSIWNNRKFRHGGLSAMLAVIVVAVAVLLNVGISMLETRFNLSVDMSKNQMFSISEQTKRTLSSLGEPVKIYGLMRTGSENVYISELMDNYRKLAPDYITTQVVDPVQNPTFARQFTDVELSENSVIITNEDGSIFEFEEKPKHPKSNKASMGIYIFKWSVLKAFLEADEADPKSENDFGKNIIPNLLNSGHKLMAYEFEGYWKDVGTINSLWEANMDLLGETPAFNIYGSAGRKIYARNYAMPSGFIAKGSEISDSFVAEGCEVYGTVHHSIISTGCTIGKGAEIRDSVIMPNVVIENGVKISHAIVAEDCIIRAGASVGADQEGTIETLEISVIGKGKTISEGTVVAPGEIL